MPLVKKWQLPYVLYATPVTIGPSTSSTSYSTVPEMTITHSFPKSKVHLVYSMTLLATDTNTSADIHVWIDGERYVGAGRVVYCPVDCYVNCATNVVIEMSAGTHTIEIVWRTTDVGATIQNPWRNRFLQLIVFPQ